MVNKSLNVPRSHLLQCCINKTGIVQPTLPDGVRPGRYHVTRIRILSHQVLQPFLNFVPLLLGRFIQTVDQDHSLAISQHPMRPLVGLPARAGCHGSGEVIRVGQFSVFQIPELDEERDEFIKGCQIAFVGTPGAEHRDPLKECRFPGTGEPADQQSG